MKDILTPEERARFRSQMADAKAAEMAAADADQTYTRERDEAWTGMADGLMGCRSYPGLETKQ